MKGVFVNVGGLFDHKLESLSGKTPLEAAYTPSLDFLLTRGESGIMFPTEARSSQFSEESILSFFGNNRDDLSLGVLDAKGLGLELKKDEVAFRVNFGTIDSLVRGNVIDRRAGRTVSDKEAKSLVKSINEIDFSYDFKLYHVFGYRAVLVIKLGDVSVLGNDILDYDKRVIGFEKIRNFKGSDMGGGSRKIAEIMDEFILASYEVLNSHPVNLSRRSKGLLPANYLFVRGGGTFDKRLKKHPKWCFVTCDISKVGFSRLSGMKTFYFESPRFSGIDSYKNYWKRLKKFESYAEKIVKKNMNNYDYFFVDFEDISVPSFDNKIYEKKAMIEYLDKTFFRFLGKVAPMNKSKVLITSSSFISSKTKSIEAEPVPVLLYNAHPPRERRVFNEELSFRGSFGRVLGVNLLRKAGFF